MKTTATKEGLLITTTKKSVEITKTKFFIGLGALTLLLCLIGGLIWDFNKSFTFGINIAFWTAIGSILPFLLLSKPLNEYFSRGKDKVEDTEAAVIICFAIAYIFALIFVPLLP